MQPPSERSPRKVCSPARHQADRTLTGFLGGLAPATNISFSELRGLSASLLTDGRECHDLSKMSIMLAVPDRLAVRLLAS